MQFQSPDTSLTFVNVMICGVIILGSIYPGGRLMEEIWYSPVLFAVGFLVGFIGGHVTLTVFQLVVLYFCEEPTVQV